MDIDDQTVAFSLDMDWVNDSILAWSLMQFEEAGLPVTIFASHRTSVLRTESRHIEIALHPNFFGRDDPKKVVSELKSLYPESKGVRAHGLFEYSNLMDIYIEQGICWDSTQLLYLCPHIMPYKHPSGLTGLPIYWEDDDYIDHHPDWILNNIRINSPGIKCFDFHPIHMYLNSISMRQYQNVKKKAFDLDAIESNRYSGEDKGVFVFFKTIAAYIKAKKIPVASIGEICGWG
jgi:Polysaccharide deacetylase